MTTTKPQSTTEEPTNASGKPLFPETLTMVACDQCDEAGPWPLRCGHTYVGIHSREYTRTSPASAAPLAGNVTAERDRALVAELMTKHHLPLRFTDYLTSARNRELADDLLSALATVRSEAAVSSYNQAIEDAKQVIRDEAWDGSDSAPIFINAIARRCSPHVYVNRLAAATAAPVGQSEHDSCSHWREGDSDNCLLCGDDLGPATDTATLNQIKRICDLGSG